LRQLHFRSYGRGYDITFLIVSNLSSANRGLRQVPTLPRYLLYRSLQLSFQTYPRIIGDCDYFFISCRCSSSILISWFQTYPRLIGDCDRSSSEVKWSTLIPYSVSNLSSANRGLRLVIVSPDCDKLIFPPSFQTHPRLIGDCDQIEEIIWGFKITSFIIHGFKPILG